MSKPFKPTKAQMAEVDRFIDKWQPLLFLHDWHIHRRFSEEPNADDSDTTAQCSADPTYRQAHLTFYPKYFGESKPELRQETVIHELCHCVTEPTKDLMYTCIVKEKQHVTNIVYQLYRRRTKLDD